MPPKQGLYQKGENERNDKKTKLKKVRQPVSPARQCRITGADIYVVRVRKTGLGDAQPCWRCLEWCRWAGIKRVFHWDPTRARWDIVRVNDQEGNLYLTRADSTNGNFVLMG